MLAAALLLGAVQALPPERPGPPAPPSQSANAPLALTLEAAIAQGLQHNVSALVAEADVRAAEGRRWTTLSALLPHVDADASAVRQKINLAAFGFTAPGLPESLAPSTSTTAGCGSRRQSWTWGRSSRLGPRPTRSRPRATASATPDASSRSSSPASTCRR